MDSNIATIRDLNSKLEELRSKFSLFKKDDLLARKEQIKKLAREHRDTMTDEKADADIREVEELNTQIAEAEKVEEEIRSCEKELKEAQERAEQENRNKEIKITMENQKIDMRTAFAKYVLFESSRGVRADARPTEEEYRALGVATTTTATEFKAPSGDADGINNGGIFIPETVVLDILKEDELESPIYRDIVTTAVKGKIKFPYRISKSGAKNKPELKDTENESVKWDILTGATGNYTDSIVITFEEEAMAIDQFTDYLIGLIGESMRELLIQDYIYGTGTDEKVKGITVGAEESTYEEGTDYLAAIEAGITKLPVNKRGGAKIYLSSDIFDAITFSKDKNGNYKLPVLNGGGFSRLSTFPVEMDPYLKAGEFIIGNVTKNYKANINKTLELGLDISHTKRIKTYAMHMMVTAAPVPKSFVYGKKNA